MTCIGLLRSLSIPCGEVFPFLILLLPSTGGEEPIPLYCPMKKSMCDTSCLGKEVSINGNATERWCHLGETHEAHRLSSAPGWRHQAPPPQSSDRTEQGQTRADASKWVWIRETKHFTWRTSKPEACVCLRALLLRNFLIFSFQTQTAATDSDSPCFRLGTSSGTHSKSSN